MTSEIAHYLQCLLLITVLPLLIVSSPGSPNRYRYVAPDGRDTSDGSIEKPWATIQHGADVAEPGDTIIVKDGVYPENVLIRNGGTQEARVTFRSEHKWKAHVSGRDVLNAQTVTITASYVTFRDFQVTGYPSTAYGIKHQHPAAHVQIIGNDVHSIGVNSRQCIQGGGIGIAGFALVDSNRVWDISSPRDAPLICNYQHGIYVLGGSHGVITNNIVFQVWQGIGIHFNGANTSYWTISNNTVVNVAAWNSGAGGASYFNCAGGICDYNIWTNNILFDSARFCWFEDSAGPGFIGKHNLYDHNLSHDCGGRYFQTGRETSAINMPPKFVKYTGDANGDYRLRAGSSGIAAGTIVGAPDSDFEGIPRPHNSTIDLGAFQHRDSYARPNQIRP